MVITDGSSGIGLAAAAALARAGDEVVLLGSHPLRLAKAVERVTDAAGGATPASYLADFAHLDQVRDVAGRLAADYDRIDVLANNAGRLAPYPARARLWEASCRAVGLSG